MGDEVALFISGEALFAERSDVLISTILMFGFIALFIPAIALSLRVLKLRLSNLIAPLGRVRWRLIATTALITFCFMGISSLISLWANVPPEDFHFDPLPPALWYYVPIIIIVIALQASAEELLFRGYLLQILGRMTKSWWIILPVVGGTFFTLHLANPEIGILGWYAYLSYALSALLFTVLALATGRLEYSIGTHIGWNWSVMIADIDPSSALDLYTGFGAIVYTGSLDSTISDAVTQVLLHVIIGLWCLTAHFKQESRHQI